MAGTGKLQSDPLFVGLTRPTMFLGVSFKYVLCNSLISIIYFINTSDFIGLFVAMPCLHMVGYIICFKEPLFIELFIIRSNKCSKCRNKSFHGANSYDFY